MPQRTPNAPKSTKTTDPKEVSLPDLPDPFGDPHGFYSAGLDVIEKALGHDFMQRFDEAVGARSSDFVDNALAAVDRELDNRLERLETTLLELASTAVATVRRLVESDR